jgi:NADH-quinone oxidoreductase subunit J
MMINIVLLSGLVCAALWTVMTVRLIRSVVGLALTSAILSAVMFRLSSPLAAVFELSVCAGLIPVIFITTVSFTQRVSNERLRIRIRERFVKFWYLPLLVVVIGALLVRYLKIPACGMPVPPQETDVRVVLWNLRHLDLIGQAIILLAGVLGVVVLFKEPQK